MNDAISQQQPLPTEALDYDLPEHLIATKPAEPRDSARMLVLRISDPMIEHRQVRDLPDYLRPNDLLIFNTSAVTPARLIGRRHDTGGRMEGLYLRADDDGAWVAMLRSNSRLRPGMTFEVFDRADRPSGFTLTLLERAGDADGPAWRLATSSDETPQHVLSRLGRTPLPPYILRARGEQRVADEQDRTWYQTVYADPGQCESVAAPTAGLHFTPMLLNQLRRGRVRSASVVLHVGAGTFKPVTSETLDEHQMHAERYLVPAPTLAEMRMARSAQAEGEPASAPRIIAVGTTTVRTLESLPEPLPDPAPANAKDDQATLRDLPAPMAGETDLLIAPPYRFKHIDGMLTNFHLPRSTLLALVAAMVGLDRLKEAYAEAVREEYRFYSYGDAMLILP